MPSGFVRAKQFTHGALTRKDLSPNPIIQFRKWFRHAQEAGVAVPETVNFSTAHLPSGRVSSRFVYLKEIHDDDDNNNENSSMSTSTNVKTELATGFPPSALSDGSSSQNQTGGKNSNQEPRKETRKGGFVIYSNWQTSHKAADLATNPHAALTFWWPELERQVRVEGIAERLTAEQSQVYFDSRIRGSRIGAWASPQSSVLTPRHVRISDVETRAVAGNKQGEAEATGASDNGRDNNVLSDEERKNGGKEQAETDDGRQELEQRVRDIEARFKDAERIPVPEFWGGMKIKPDIVEFWQGRPSRLHDRFRYTLVSADGGSSVDGEDGEEGKDEAAVAEGKQQDDTAAKKSGRGKEPNKSWKIERLAP